jgi:hypothetical protein
MYKIPCLKGFIFIFSIHSKTIKNLILRNRMLVQCVTIWCAQGETLTWRDLTPEQPFFNVSARSSFPATNSDKYFRFSSSLLCSATTRLHSLATYTSHIHNIQKQTKPTTKWINIKPKYNEFHNGIYSAETWDWSVYNSSTSNHKGPFCTTKPHLE